MYQRLLTPPKKTFLLFGPRGTGKSTWLATHFKRAGLVLDLLHSNTYLDLLADPSRLGELTRHLQAKEWVVIDEVQRVPALLSEVHALYEKRGLQFALSGSSARKLRRGGADMLAGRALQRHLFALTHAEIPASWSMDQRLLWGSLPGLVSEPEHARDTLLAYVETYLRQEVMEEGLVRRLEPFARFLRVAGAYNGQVLNMDNLAREAHVARATVANYFDILEDTLIISRLPAYRPGALVKEVSHPKIFFFDAGVARAAAGLLFDPPDSLWQGAALETLVFNELAAYNHYANKGRQIAYYRASSGLEVDFVVELRRKTLQQPAQVLLVEAKSAKRWDPRWSKPARELADRRQSLRVARSIGVYLGDQRLTSDGFEVWPLTQFLDALHKGEIF